MCGLEFELGFVVLFTHQNVRTACALIHGDGDIARMSESERRGIVDQSPASNLAVNCSAGIGRASR